MSAAQPQPITNNDGVQYDVLSGQNSSFQQSTELLLKNVAQLEANGFTQRAKALKEQLFQKGFKFNTLSDLMVYHYPFLMDDNFMAGYSLSKADAPLLSSTTGAYTAVHGFEAMEQIVQEQNLFGMLRKTVYNLGGFRGLTAAGATSGGGVSENAAIPDTIKPTLQNVNVPIKEFAISFETSMRNEFLSQTQNDVWRGYEGAGGSAMAALRAYFSTESGKLINRQLLGDNDTLAGNNFESIDRIVGSYSEINGVGQTAGDLDIYGLDRDAGASWADSYVNHNSGTDRDLTVSQVKDIMANVRKHWRNPNDKSNKVWLTGYDTQTRIEQIYESQMVYNPQGATIQPSVNGIQTLNQGQAAGMEVATLYGIPMIVSDDVPQDTISRMYLLDLDRLEFQVGMPMQYFEGGAGRGSIIELDKFATKAAYYMSGETVSHRFNCHGKLRDLQ